MKVTLYTKPACVQCRASAKKLDLEGIEYEVIDMSVDADAFTFVKDRLGYSAAPVVVVSNDVEGTNITSITDSWAGYQPAKIEALNTNKENQ